MGGGINWNFVCPLELFGVNAKVRGLFLFSAPRKGKKHNLLRVGRGLRLWGVISSAYKTRHYCTARRDVIFC